MNTKNKDIIQTMTILFFMLIVVLTMQNVTSSQANKERFKNLEIHIDSLFNTLSNDTTDVYKLP
jgi:hypothetical protein